MTSHTVSCIITSFHSHPLVVFVSCVAPHPPVPRQRRPLTVIVSSFVLLSAPLYVSSFDCLTIPLSFFAAHLPPFFVSCPFSLPFSSPDRAGLLPTSTLFLLTNFHMQPPPQIVLPFVWYSQQTQLASPFHLIPGFASTSNNSFSIH